MFDIGSSLHEARTRQGLAFDEMEERTKVRSKYLRHLEDERFDQLPGHTYTKGFLRVYADALGLDGELYVDEYNSRYVGLDEELSPRLPTRTSRGRERRRGGTSESKTVALALGAIVLATALVIAAWRFGGEDTPRVQGVNTTLQTPGANAADGRVTLLVTAAKGPTFLEVRVGSPSGTPLFSGTLERGRSQRFTKKTLFISVARPANVIVKVDGKRVPIESGQLTLGGGTTVGG
jgi:Helix-turn-helix domain